MGAAQFWSIATLMVVATTATLVVPLFWRKPQTVQADLVATKSTPRWRRFAFAVAAAVPLAALAIYSLSGSVELATQGPAQTAIDDVSTMHARAAVRDGASAGDLEVATEKLRARLAANPADASGWRLLAQAYEYQGRTTDAVEANKLADAAERGAAPAPAVASAALDATAIDLARQAEDHRRRREFPQAVAAFAALAKRDGMSADLWADYADALGGARGTLDEESAAIIAAALRLEPDHPKALWLLATWQTQRQDYAAATATWQRLAQLLPPDSPDARIIAANLQEARSKSSSVAATPAPAPAAGAIAVRGSVRLDPRWRKRVSSDTVVFVFARAADERGPPLAVLRTNAGSWPMSFVLDDRHAMMPGRKLSDFSRVIIEARISPSGNALAQPGDLRGVSAVLDPRASQELQLTISEEIGAAQPPKGG